MKPRTEKQLRLAAAVIPYENPQHRPPARQRKGRPQLPARSSSTVGMAHVQTILCSERATVQSAEPAHQIGTPAAKHHRELEAPGYREVGPCTGGP